MYFSPPETEQMKYPCIVYFRSNEMNIKADNLSYLKYSSWDLTVIDWDPDSELPEKLLDHFEFIRSDREYRADNLNHFSFHLFY